MLDETPAEVTFLGQRESTFINIVIYPNNPISVCEIEASGRLSFFFFGNAIKHCKPD